MKCDWSLNSLKSCFNFFCYYVSQLVAITSYYPSQFISCLTLSTNTLRNLPFWIDARANLLLDLMEGSMMPVSDFFMGIDKSYKIMSELSKGTPFCRRIHVRPQHPLLSSFGLVYKAKRDLIEFQFETRSELIQFYLLVGYLLVSVMSKTDYIILVCQCYDPLRIRLCYGKKMLQGCLNPQAQACCEVVEDQVRIYLRHGLQFLVDIMTQDYILKAKVEGGSNRQMAQNQSIGLPSMFMQKDNIRNPFSKPKLDKFLKHCSTPIDPLRVGKQNGEFLGKLKQSIGGVS